MPTAEPYSTITALLTADLPSLPYPQLTNNLLLRLQLNQHLTAFLQHHKHKERTASVGMYGLRLCSHVRPQTPVTYEQDNCRANMPAIYKPDNRRTDMPAT